MKVITIKEPWASLIVNGYKKYEFRTWPTNYRGKLLIHAGKTTSKRIKEFDHYHLKYGYGEIIGEVTIDDCKIVDKIFKNDLLKENNKIYQNVEGNRYAFCLIKPIKYTKTIPIKGQLGLWNYVGEDDEKNNI